MWEKKQDERDKIIDHLTQQLVNSCFERRQIHEIVSSGLKGYENRIERRRKAKENFYRKAGETLEERTRKQLTEKLNWFKKRKEKIMTSSRENVTKRQKRNTRVVN